MFGLGFELETGIFYKVNNKTYSVNIGSLYKVRYYKNLTKKEIKLLTELPLWESPSNMCLVKISSKQIELVTTQPINKTLETAINELKKYSNIFLIIFQKLFNEKNGSKNIKLFYPEISCMSYFDTDGKKVFSNTGSLHINISFPHTGKKQLNDYKKFIKLFQTLEPLLTAVTTSGDYRSKYSDKFPISGYRQIIGWGISGGSDYKLLKYGLSKTATRVPEYIKKLKKYKYTVLDKEECYSFRNKMDKKFYQKLGLEIPKSNFSSDISTIKKKYNNNVNIYFREQKKNIKEVQGYLIKDLREKFAYRIYEEGYGLEIRFFDWMKINDIEEMTKLIILLGDFSFNTSHLICDPVINKYWNQEMLNVFEKGYKTNINENYIKLLEKNFEMKINKIENMESVINQISKYLFEKYGNGNFVKIMTDSKKLKSPPKIFNMNKLFLENINKLV